MRGSTRRTRAARAAAAIGTLACVGALSACDPVSAGTPRTTSDGPSPSATPTPSASPSASPSPSPSPSPSATEGPITGEPAGSPVTPEVFLTTVDTDAGLLRVVVFVPDIYEDGGTCTTTVTDHAVTRSKHNTGASNATNTACGEFDFSLAALPTGTATIVASYSSPKYEGSSEPTEVQIP